MGDLFSGILPFLHTAEERSFGKAAVRLGVSTAAVSKSVKRLEERLGVKLLVRTSRTVSLTPEGAQFLERCREAVASMQSGRDLMSQSRRLPRGEVHLTLSFIVGRLVVQSLLRCSTRYPHLSFRFTMTDRLVPLAQENIDLAVRVGAREDSALVSRLLCASRWVTVASPAYLARHGKPAHPDDLAALNCVRFVAPNGRPRDYSFRERRAKTAAVVPVRGNLLIDNGDLLLSAATSGLGVVQVLDFMVEEPLRTGELVEVLGPFSAEGPPIHVVTTPERARAPNVRATMTYLAETFERREARHA
jgi:DNA-binding transcriptional LysR family regulator